MSYQEGKAMKDVPLERLIVDDQAAGLFRVNRRVFTEAEYLALEHRRIFETCWIYAGHESEVPKAGDFRSRRVAGRPVILVRGDDGAVRVLLNTCTHRGALVCRAQCGNARTFQCAYHAWTFNTQVISSAFPARIPTAPLSIVRKWRSRSRRESIATADSYLSTSTARR